MVIFKPMISLFMCVKYRQHEVGSLEKKDKRRKSNVKVKFDSKRKMCVCSSTYDIFRHLSVAACVHCW